MIATVGESDLGDIAIDDISVSEGYCVVDPATPPPFPSQGPPISPGKYLEIKIIN